MKMSFLIASAALLLAAFALSQLPRSSALAQTTDTTIAKKTETRFYCDRSAIASNQMKRKLELGQAVRTSIRHTRELPNGFEFELSGSASFQQASEWASLERLCCPFFDISLQLTRDKGPTLLRLTGEPGVKQFIQSEFGPEWFAAADRAAEKGER